MGTKNKLITRFKTLPKDFSWEEVNRMLVGMGYSLRNKGKTSGSRVIFICEGRKPIMLHKPHPGNIIKEYVLKQLFENLKEEGLI
ncbi:MAG: type II toxin-antitoxin system HicA family toxin [Muribaculaceae bacterium]|nr:type II toxin-antitoxin system HicA family toxin [Muribaculaceae bacterium]MDE6795449.1 type II toxin-antitoxin system HicA family toxin [Muribaculaceae bacterium]